MQSLILMLILAAVFLLSSVKALQLQRSRRQVKRRLELVAVNTTFSREKKALFDWEQGTGPLLTHWNRVQSRIDALFGRKGKLWLLLGLVTLALAVWFVGTFFPLVVRAVSTAGAVVVAALASYWVMRIRQRKEFEETFPQVLGQISRAVAAGISVPQAIAQVADYQKGMLGREFVLIRDQLEIGISLKQALREACYRLPYSGFHFFVVALVLNEENGGQLREVLHGLSRTLHDNVAIKMKIKSLTAEPRMTAMILASLPVLLISIMFFKNPTAFLNLTNTDAGQFVLAYVVGSMALGLGIIHMLTKVRS
ncbi:type II secretion system F family protein [Photobacterium kasasachensis]|uniref:type II secretion system F family protein n=1 Tax=Photobacterium kasasachensis TaxID=2910240 RepID=UPI003D14F7CD